MDWSGPIDFDCAVSLTDACLDCSSTTMAPSAANAVFDMAM